jgi:hypothetical protein
LPRFGDAEHQGHESPFADSCRIQITARVRAPAIGLGAVPLAASTIVRPRPHRAMMRLLVA